MANITLDFHKTGARFKPINGVGQPPKLSLTDHSLFHYLTEARIPFSRLHDVGGPYGGGVFVDIPNVFRDFDADPTDPANYDFAFSDLLIKDLLDAKVEPFFRLGVTIENFPFVKRYTTFPPKDFEKWARICEGVVAHYTEGWAGGFTDAVRYFEIWNEPDDHPDPKQSMMWEGTMEEYIELYRVTATHLKARFPKIKVGGYASCGFYGLNPTLFPGMSTCETDQYFLKCFYQFFTYAEENRLPLDFFSFHSYERLPQNRAYIRYAREYLDAHGYQNAEIILDEWNPKPEFELRGTALHASLVADMLIMFSEEPLDAGMFYDARIGVSVYGSLFNPDTHNPYPAYYAFLAFGQLTQGKQVKVAYDAPLMAAAAADGKTGYLLLSNSSDGEVPVTLSAPGTLLSANIVTDGKTWESETVLPQVLPAHTVLLATFAI